MNRLWMAMGSPLIYDTIVIDRLLIGYTYGYTILDHSH